MDIAILAVGNMLAPAVETAELLSNRGVSARVISLHTVKPLDAALLAYLFESFPLIAVMEEHSLTGGATSAILEWACTYGKDARKLCPFAGPDRFLTGCGEQDEARESLGLIPSAMSRKLLDRFAAL